MTQEPAWHPSDIAPIPDPDADGPKRRGRIPQSAWPRILDMHRSGVTLTAIAREFDCTPSAISYIVRKAEGAVPKAGDTDTPDMPPLIAAIDTPVSSTPAVPVVTTPPVIREESAVTVAPVAVEAPAVTSEPVADSAVGRVEPARGDYSRPEQPNRDIRPQQGRYAERQGGERPAGERPVGERPNGERIGNDQGRRPPVSMGSPNGPRPNYQPGPRPDRPAGERLAADRPMTDRTPGDRVPGDRQGPPPDRQPGVERYGQDRQGPDRQGQERQGQDRMAGPRPNGDRFGGERRPNDRIQGDRNMGDRNPGDRNQGDRFQNERTPYDRSAQQRAEGERAFADRGPDRNGDRAERFQGDRPERVMPERVMPERAAPVLPDVLPPDNFSGTGPSDVVYPYRQQRHAGRIEASETPTVPADQRMAATATACADAFRAWKAAPATVGTQPLADALHELRRVIARMEIEMSASRREEQRPLPIPNYRFNHAPPQQPRG